ncbi:MAG: hypothetical protein E7620_06400 [Ruminococcaceae bacterium]|nr:hypothetical protein [Oscillospiraceae bacterium]
MNCSLIRDLIILCVEKRCSQESIRLVEEHIGSCETCRAFFEEQKAARSSEKTVIPDFRSRINGWKASVLQSVLMLASFAVIVFGVSLEAATPRGILNGFWAFSLVVPAVGFLISLCNWNFIRAYKSRRSFSVGSFWITCGGIFLAFLWTAIHYELSVGELIQLTAELRLADILELLVAGACYFGLGLVVSIGAAVGSKVLSRRYASMLGKE